MDSAGGFSALLGSTGFVGSSLNRQASFRELFNSKNMRHFRGEFEVIYCAAAPGTKWLANQEPEEDFRNIEALVDALKRVQCGFFVLISTVDVFGKPVLVDEDSSPDVTASNPYGRNRRFLELRVRELFENTLVVRLPGLVGAGLRKNALYDMHNGINLSGINPSSELQFYPISRLYQDIQVARRNGLQTVHLCSEPISLGEINLRCFGRSLGVSDELEATKYDFQTKHAPLFNVSGNYQVSKESVISEVIRYHAEEPFIR